MFCYMDLKDFNRRVQGNIPRLGKRIIKTAVAVYICLVINYLRGFGAETMSTDAAITALICMQNTVDATKQNAFFRLMGTLVGAVWGLVFMLLLYSFHSSHHILLSYVLISLGVMIVIYTTVLIKKPESSSLAAIVFICMLIPFSIVDSPAMYAIKRFDGVLIGTLVSFLVNQFRLPMKQDIKSVFFVKIRDLGQDSYSRLSPSVIYQLQSLFSRGAKVCLISDHAPAYVAMQLSSINPTVPQIVMDGAAIYSSADDRYLWKQTIPDGNDKLVRQYLDSEGLNYFIATVHRNKTCLFHCGKDYTPEEKKVYDKLKSSPYRHYLQEEVFDEAEVVSFKIVGKTEDITALEKKLYSDIPVERFRIVRRKERDENDISSLYIFDADATLDYAKTKIIEFVGKGTPLTPVDVFLSDGYRYRNDALHVLSLVEHKFEKPGFSRN